MWGIRPIIRPEVKFDGSTKAPEEFLSSARTSEE
jgi:hypothetical protein